MLEVPITEVGRRKGQLESVRVDVTLGAAQDCWFSTTFYRVLVYLLIKLVHEDGDLLDIWKLFHIIWVALTNYFVVTWNQ